MVVQSYDSLALIVQQAFGSPSSSGGTSPPVTKTASTLAEMQEAMKGHF